MTNRTSRPSVWNDVFHHYGGYVLVEFADGRLVAGWVKFYSDLSNAPSLFLQDAAWITSSGQQLPIQGAGILITSACGIKTVSFHQAKDNTVEQKAANAASGK